MFTKLHAICLWRKRESNGLCDARNICFSVFYFIPNPFTDAACPFRSAEYTHDTMSKDTQRESLTNCSGFQLQSFCVVFLWHSYCCKWSVSVLHSPSVYSTPTSSVSIVFICFLTAKRWERDIAGDKIMKEKQKRKELIWAEDSDQTHLPSSVSFPLSVNVSHWL